MLLRITIAALLFAVASSRVFAGEEHEKHANEEIVRLSAEVMKQYRIELVKVGPKTLEIKREILGEIVPNANKTICLHRLIRHPCIWERLVQE